MGSGKVHLTCAYPQKSKTIPVAFASAVQTVFFGKAAYVISVFFNKSLSYLWAIISSPSFLPAIIAHMV
jgi:hypothetical protein